jgi:tetratricopeptide (TPR) repeat protein
VRLETLLKILVGVLLIGTLVVSAALLRFVFAGGKGTTPRTELERAVVAAEQAVAGAPNDPDARIKLAAAYYEQGGASAAAKQAEIAVRLEPQKPDPYYMLGIAQLKLGQTQDAVKNLTKAINTSGQTAAFYEDVYVQLAHAQEKAGDPKGALASMGKAIDSNPENVLLLVERGGIFERQSQWYLAAVDYGWAVRFSPDYEPGASALLRIAKNHPAEAKKAADRVTLDFQGDEAPGFSTHPTVTPTP